MGIGAPSSDDDAIDASCWPEVALQTSAIRTVEPGPARPDSTTINHPLRSRNKKKEKRNNTNNNNNIIKKRRRRREEEKKGGVS